MNSFLYLLIMDVTCIASGTFLVYTGHPGWAWLPFLFAATTTVKDAHKSADSATERKS